MNDLRMKYGDWDTFAKIRKKSQGSVSFLCPPCNAIEKICFFNHWFTVSTVTIFGYKQSSIALAKKSHLRYTYHSACGTRRNSDKKRKRLLFYFTKVENCAILYHEFVCEVLDHAGTAS